LACTLTLAALGRALERHRPKFHHSDQGVQYAATDYVDRLLQVGARISMAAAGQPEENGFVERLIRTIKEVEAPATCRSTRTTRTPAGNWGPSWTASTTSSAVPWHWPTRRRPSSWSSGVPSRAPRGRHASSLSILLLPRRPAFTGAEAGRRGRRRLAVDGCIISNGTRWSHFRGPLHSVTHLVGGS